MRIWTIENYATPPEVGHFTRHYNFGKCLSKMGHAPVVFAGSHPHNTDRQMIDGPEKYRVYREDPFPWILVKTANYEGSRKKQVLTMFQFYYNAKKAAKYAAEKYGKPDVILGSSAHPLAALLAVRLGKKYGCRAVAEIRDLWPESIVAYGIVGAHNPAVVALRWLEKWIYTHADAVIFTMENAYAYIRERHWEKAVPESKVFYVNNGVDLEQFDYNREHFIVNDPDLDNPDAFKVVYTGSIRKVNNLGQMLDAAKLVTNPRIKFLIWGAGYELEALEKRVRDEGISNVVFKGRVEKKYVPSIVSRADVNFAHYSDTPLLRYGISFNKLFEYLAAGKPVIFDFWAGHNPALPRGAGVSSDSPEPRRIAAIAEKLAALPPDAYEAFCINARKAAEAYDFKVLTQKLISILKGENLA